MLIRYAYLVLSYFSDSPEVTVSEIKLPPLAVRSLRAKQFEFRFEGWLAGDVDKEVFEARAGDEFEKQLQYYFHRAAIDLDLDELKADHATSHQQ